ncbi:hypothetical protein BXU06_02175 [Aquaspirillum sp. LM1]|uniref:MarR family transcriptional regulator n=1 Tax=Aquaspirillum sp. LM1 TaxID=1938604 RepID=UPI0009839F80|nr:MarR family transcriptional regulator [Aquaspirillum sp. LM1]AQR63998.1 hypothetical protein BXU06_02175 [Aquaspirillum sp. LM1]
MTDDITKCAEALRLALLDNETEAARSHQNWLMGKAASALLRQDEDSLRAFRAALAGLPAVADRFGEGKKGDRWRTVWELVDAFCETPRPLEQARLAKVAQVSGKVLLAIRNEPGISPGELVTQLGKTNSHVSNVLRQLIEQGLVHRLAEGRSGRCFLTTMGRQQVEAMRPEATATVPQKPVKASSTQSRPQPAGSCFLYIDSAKSHWTKPYERPSFSFVC